MAHLPSNRDAGDDGTPMGDLFAPLDGRAGPARRLSSAVTAEMVRSVVDRALDTPDDVREDTGPVPLPAAAPPRRRRYTLAFAAAALIALSIGTGAGAVAWRVFNIDLGDPEPARAPARQRRVAQPPPPPPPAPAPAPEPQVLEVVDVVIPPQVAEPERRAPVRHVAKKRKRVHIAQAPAAPAPSEPAPAPVVVPENAPPEDLLAFANERRQRREWREADVFYQAVMSRFPGADAAMVAEVASATLHLKHLGDATGALAAYHRSLAAHPAGPLAEEARWGVAEAHRAFGDAQAEAQALREFLQRHPQSTLAPAARRRLAQLAP